MSDHVMTIIQQALELALGHHRAGRLEEARAVYVQVLSDAPQHAEALHLLAVVQHQLGESDSALELLTAAITLNAGSAEYFNSLAVILIDRGEYPAALEAAEQAVRLRPSLPEAHNSRGLALYHTANVPAAAEAFARAIELRPEFPEAHANLGNALASLGRSDDAAAHYRRAIELNPNDPSPYNNLGLVLKDYGLFDEAIEQFRRALALRPDFAVAHSNLLYTTLFHPGYDPASIRAEHDAWRRRHADPLKASIRPHANDRDPHRRLKIGYVSADLRDHVIGRNAMPLVRERDRAAFHVTCYSGVTRPDAVTQQFKELSDEWRDTAGWSDERLAEQIRADGIDILVDLTLHMERGRLLTFARQPAPVQVTFIGYPGTTGLDTIRYRITDPHLDPPGESDAFYSERSIRLPDSFWCYEPAVDIPVADPPVLGSGHVTFGCIGNFCKVNRQVVELWSRVLRSVPGSRMIVLCDPGSQRDRLLAMFAGQGVDRSRIDPVGRAPIRAYFERYHQIDVLLDTFPYNGHNTSLDALWMGVPVVSLVGQTVVGRAGLSILTNLGQPELCATSAEDFVRIATTLAADPDRLTRLRQSLRDQLKRSPLMDPRRFTSQIESAYRAIWRAWVAST